MICLEQRVKGGYLLEFAESQGELGSFNYHPHTDMLRSAYASGLNKWLNSNQIDGIDAFKLADPAIMKGFVYYLVANGKLTFKTDDGSDINQAEIIGKEIEITLKQYKSLGKIITEILEEKERFQKGIRLAKDYLEQESSRKLSWLSSYGFDPKKLSDSTIKRYRKIHHELDGEIAKGLMDDNNSTIQDEFLLYMALYDRKKAELDDSLANGNRMDAQKQREFLELTLRYLVNDNAVILSEDGGGIVRKSFTECGCTELMEKYDVAGKLQEISRLRTMN